MQYYKMNYSYGIAYYTYEKNLTFAIALVAHVRVKKVFVTFVIC